MTYVCDLSMKGNPHYHYDKYWHEVAREGLPKESGNYLGIDYDHENEPYNFWVDDWEECDFTDLLAWHKIPNYEG